MRAITCLLNCSQFSVAELIKKTAATGKETILRTLPTGELVAAPVLFGYGVAPATVVAEQDCQILTYTNQTSERFWL